MKSHRKKWSGWVHFETTGRTTDSKVKKNIVRCKYCSNDLTENATKCRDHIIICKAAAVAIPEVVASLQPPDPDTPDQPGSSPGHGPSRSGRRRKTADTEETQAQTLSPSHPQLVPVAMSQSDRISQVMGQNLLKGFALLDEHCGTCETPLMRDPQRNLLCVACPLIREANQASGGESPSATEAAPKIVSECEAGLRSKLQWAVDELQVTTDVKCCIELNILIKGLAENIKSLREVE